MSNIIPSKTKKGLKRLASGGSEKVVWLSWSGKIKIST